MEIEHTIEKIIKGLIDRPLNDGETLREAMSDYDLLKFGGALKAHWPPLAVCWEITDDLIYNTMDEYEYRWRTVADVAAWIRERV